MGQMRTLANPSRQLASYLFLAPAVTILFLFFLLPAAISLVLSLTDFDIYALADYRYLRWIGGRNYQELVRSSIFWQALRNTLFFVVVAGPATLLVSLGVALLLTSRSIRASGLYRTVFFAPVVATIVAVAVVWRYLCHTRFGLINHGLTALGIPRIDWLGDPHWSMPAIILLCVWKNFGYTMVIFIAGLQNVRQELYEAAELDGASYWQRLWHITMPALVPTLIFAGVTTLIGYLQLFAEPYVMTRGGPLHSTYSLVMLMYEQGFRWWNLGYAAATAFVLFLLVFMMGIVARRWSPGLSP